MTHTYKVALKEYMYRNKIGFEMGFVKSLYLKPLNTNTYARLQVTTRDVLPLGERNANKLYMRQPINGEWYHWTWSERLHKSERWQLI